MPTPFANMERGLKEVVHAKKKLAISFHKQINSEPHSTYIKSVATYQSEPEEICEDALLLRGLMGSHKKTRQRHMIYAQFLAKNMFA